MQSFDTQLDFFIFKIRLLRLFVLLIIVLARPAGVDAQELWHNDFYHTFQGSTDLNPNQHLFNTRSMVHRNDHITILAKMWSGAINVDPEGSEVGLMDNSTEPLYYRRLTLIRYDTSGSFLWRKYISNFVPPNQSEPIGQVAVHDGAMAMDTSGTMHVASTFYGQLDISSDDSGAYVHSIPFGPTEQLVQSAYVARYGVDGDLLESNVIASRNSASGGFFVKNIATASDGSTFVLLSFVGEILVHTSDGDLSFGGSQGAPQVQNVVLIKLNPGNEVEWVRPFAGESSSMSLQKLAVDGNDHVVYAGQWTGTLILNPTDPENYTLSTESNEKGVYWVSLTASGDFVAGDAYTSNGSTLNLRGLQVSPNGSIYVVINDVGFNLFSSGEEITDPDGDWNTRILKYSGNGDLQIIRDNVPGGIVFPGAEGNPAILYTNGVSEAGVPYNFNSISSEPVIFEGFQGTHRLLLNYDSDINLTKAALLNRILSFGNDDGKNCFPLLLNNDKLIYSVDAAPGMFIIPDLQQNFSYTFNDRGFILAKYYTSTTLSNGEPGFTQAATIKAYPNPVSDVLHLELAYPDEVAQVELISLEGKMQWSRSGMQSGLRDELRLALSNLPQGIYMLKSMQRGAQQVLRLVKINN